jgi:hypothetical protein
VPDLVIRRGRSVIGLSFDSVNVAPKRSRTMQVDLWCPDGMARHELQAVPGLLEALAHGDAGERPN